MNRLGKRHCPTARPIHSRNILINQQSKVKSAYRYLYVDNSQQNDAVQTFYLPTVKYIFKDEAANQIQSSRQINDAETEKDIHLPPSRPIDDAALSLYNPQKWNNDISQQSEFFGFESEECWNEGTPIEQPIPDNYNKPQLEQSAPKYVY